MVSFTAAVVVVIAALGVAGSGQLAMLKEAAPSERSPLSSASETRNGAAHGIAPLHLYNGVHQPLMVEVVMPRTIQTVRLALMDTAGHLLSRPVEVRVGRFDLGEVMPDIWTLRQTSYVQVIYQDQPVGPALVLQPMLSRIVPVTVQDQRPGGATYTRIIGWRDEHAPEPEPEPEPAPAPTSSAATASPPSDPAPGDSDDGNDEETEGQAGKQAPPLSSPPPPVSPASTADRVFSGFRAYVEHDVVLRTTKGDIRIALRPDEAPNTAWNFLELARGGFYRNIVFHRVVKYDRNGRPFVIQAGDPTANAYSSTGDGGPGYWLAIENSQLQHDFGVISMARADHPDSAGSQFFICLSREGTARLDGQYCSFGYAVDGAATIEAIADSSIIDFERMRPADPPIIRSADLVPAPPRIVGKGRPDQRVSPPSAEQPPKPTRVPR